MILRDVLLFAIYWLAVALAVGVILAFAVLEFAGAAATGDAWTCQAVVREAYGEVRELLAS